MSIHLFSLHLLHTSSVCRASSEWRYSHYIIPGREREREKYEERWERGGEEKIRRGPKITEKGDENKGIQGEKVKSLEEICKGSKEVQER